VLWALCQVLVFHISHPGPHATVRHPVLLQGIAMQSILHAMVEQGGPPEIDFDFVLVVGHFLTRDENIFTFFEARLPADLLFYSCVKHPLEPSAVPACSPDEFGSLCVS
jgi:hypothetical protein